MSDSSLTLGCLDDPESIKPRRTTGTRNTLSWFKCEDELPKYAELPPIGEG